MKPMPQQDFVHTDFPEPRTKVKGIEVWHWDNPSDAEELLKKYWPHLYLPKPTKVDYEV